MLAVSQSLWYFSKRTRADTKYTKVVPKLSMASMTHVAVAAHMPARQADSQYSLSCCKNILRQICESHRWLKFVFLKNTFALKIVHVYITAKCAPSKMFHEHWINVSHFSILFKLFCTFYAAWKHNILRALVPVYTRTTFNWLSYIMLFR